MKRAVFEWYISGIHSLSTNTKRQLLKHGSIEDTLGTDHCSWRWVVQKEATCYQKETEDGLKEADKYMAENRPNKQIQKGVYPKVVA